MKRIVLIAGGILLAGLATGLTCVALAASQGREVARADDEGLLIPTVVDEDDRDSSPWVSQHRRETSGASARIKNRRQPKLADGGANDDNASRRPAVKQDSQLARVLLPCLAGCMAMAGVALLVRGLRSRPAKRRRQKLANTAVLVENAGTRRRREFAAPATVAFALRSRPDRTVRTGVELPQETEETRELRRAA